MDIYRQRSNWKIYLAIAGLLIVSISMLNTNYLYNRLSEEEARKVKHYEMAQELINDIDEDNIDNCDYTLHTKIIESNTSIPVILVDERGEVIAAANFGSELDTNYVYLKKVVADMEAEGFEPIEGYAYKIYYKESKILTQLRYFPLIQLLLIAAFVFFGYLGFNYSRKAEQNRVWVGMAKETAHQLGTPISAIVAWLEHLREIRDGDPELQEVVTELSNDVNRLELIADRFSKIGSAPHLQSSNIFEELNKCRTYMERRAPRKVSFVFPDPREATPLYVPINQHLFEWVVENLLRNALDAMEGQGEIRAEVHADTGFVYVDLSDTGKGIPGNKFKAVFQPGYTTKKRGWGLGLSLAKRIIEQYHNGKIFVKKSTESKGSTFTIKLPRAENA